LDRVSGVFYNLAGADSTEAREALMRDLAPKMSAFASEITNNKAAVRADRGSVGAAMRWGWMPSRCGC
jgi:Zn-dependent oligopeptidase